MDSLATRLPEGCVSEFVSFTSASDASRLSSVSKEFKSGAESDPVWERFLPLDYQEIISTAVYPVKFATKKDLYIKLSDSPVLIQGGKMSFSVDKKSGKKCFMVGARELMISWKSCWEYKPHANTRFSEVANLISIGWIHIQGKIKFQMLSKNTTYAAYLVFWLERMDGLKSSQTVIRFLNDQSKPNMSKNKQFECRETGKMAKMRGDGWLEIEMGKFYSDCDDDGEVEVWLTEINNTYGKFGLIVEGVERRKKEKMNHNGNGNENEYRVIVVG